MTVKKKNKMEITQYLDKFKEIQASLLEYIESQDDINENFNNLVKILKKFDIKNHKHEFKLFIHLFSAICVNHHHACNFYDKIFSILQFFKTEIMKHYSNNELIDVFKGNKRIILYFIDEQIITISKDYESKLFPEINQENKSEDFEKNRRIGENENHICSIIREDSLDEFIQYINETNIKLSTGIIPSSIYETNPFLRDKELSIIEYSTFFGAIRIFNYLLLNKIELTPSLWPFAIHSNNAEIIQILEERNISPKDDKYVFCLNEAIKCHHNSIANHILANHMDEDEISFQMKYIYDNHLANDIFGYYNFVLFDYIEFNSIYIFFYYCKFDYFDLVELYLNNKQFNFKELKNIYIILRNLLFLIQFYTSFKWRFTK